MGHARYLDDVVELTRWKLEILYIRCSSDERYSPEQRFGYRCTSRTRFISRIHRVFDSIGVVYEKDVGVSLFVSILQTESGSTRFTLAELKDPRS